MIKNSALIAILLAASSATTACAAQTPAPVPVTAVSDPASVVDAFHAALGSGDREAALALLDDQVLILEGGGAERSKAEYASHHLGADVAFSKAVTSEVSKRTSGVVGDLAWVATEARTSGSFRGRDIDKLSAETMVLRRDGAGWKIVHIHWSSADPR